MTQRDMEKPWYGRPAGRPFIEQQMHEGLHTMMNRLYTYRPRDLTTTDLEALEIELAERLTRRRFVIGAGGLIGAAALGACGAGEATTTPTAPRASTGYPRTVEHAEGTTTLETKPTRIYTARTFSELDALLALAVIPVLVGSFPGRPLKSWQIANGAAQAEVMDMTGGQPNLERMTALDIDLVVVNEGLSRIVPEEVDALRQVAPVVALPITLNFIEQLQIVAACLDLSIAEVETTIAAIEAAYAAFTVAQPPTNIAAITVAGGIYMPTTEHPASELMQRIGLPAFSAPASPLSVNGVVEISAELLDEIDAEIVLGLEREDPALLDELEASPIFQQIPAVQNGKYYRLSLEHSDGLIAPSILSVPVVLAALQDIFSTRDQG
ncbi:MAG: ABC transporter substrate-binding protein [Chloroflexales bacterium]|nr:ABC transporter substrate-binding protein [Chloroflexales bacterium]